MITDKLLSFLTMTTDDVFRYFGGVTRKEWPRYFYHEGTNPNKVLLVAHADTVWGNMEITPKLVGDIIYSESTGKLHQQGLTTEEIREKGVGIGADDRAGIYCLDYFKDSGHSILITEGEEIGLGPKILAELPEIQKIVYSHRFALEFDRGNDYDVVFYNKESQDFKDYVLSFFPSYKEGEAYFTDIAALCRNKIQSVNVSVGYRSGHTPSEFLRISSLQRTIELSEKFLNNFQNEWLFKGVNK